MRAAEQGLRKNPFKIEISIKTFSYSVKFEVRKKTSMGFTEILFLCRGWTSKKIWHTAMAESATDRSGYIVASRCGYRENVLDEK